MAFCHRVLFVVFLFFICSVEESYAAAGGKAHRRGRKDTGTGKQAQINVLKEGLKEVQEGVRSELKALRDDIKALSTIIEATLPQDCWAAKLRGDTSRKAMVKLPGVAAREVMCDQTNEGGGWTVILARHPTTLNHTERENFNRTWNEYKEGFGNVSGEYWIGNDVLHSLTSQRPQQLFVLLEDWNHNKAKGMWNNFMIGNEEDNYRLSVQDYDEAISTAGDSFRNHHGHNFSTYDRDNDTHDRNHCAKQYGGGWWYFRCHTSHLTGKAVPRGDGGHHAITWRNWTHTTGLRSAYMAIRPKATVINDRSCHP